MGVVDADGDIVEPNAFDISIAENLPIPVLSGHDQGKLVGKVIFAQPRHIEGDEYRLFTRMQMNMETEAGRDAFSNVAGDFVREWSIGFNIAKDDDVTHEGSDVSTVIRHISNIDWVEVSSVIRGSSPSTATVAAKSSPCAEKAGRKPSQLRSAGLPDNSKPYPNFHACRIREPDEFDRFRTASETVDDKPVEVLYGREKESGDWDIASYRLPSGEWTEAEARTFCEDHDGIKFEPATGEEDSDATDDTASDTAPEAALDTAERTLRLQRVKLALHGIKNQTK
jgi:HK97 family phage prohead protease